jgi:hypothetical protein
MVSDYDPAGLEDVKNKIFQQIDPVLEEHGFEKARSGSQTPLREFDNSTGFWEGSILSKPPRWLFHLVQNSEEWEARLPDHDRNDRVGYYNLSNRDNVAALVSRILPVVKQDGSWVPYEEWEWLGMIFLPEPARGTSGQDINGFAPPNFDLECRGEELNPISVHVYALCDPKSTCSVVPDDLTYEEATNALRGLFGVTTAEEEESSNEE